MPHEFRTIEEFVLYLETAAVQANQSATSMLGRPGHFDAVGRQEAKRDAYQEIADLVRTSNIGIVYPKSEGERLHTQKCDLVIFGHTEVCCTCGGGNPT